MLRAHLNIYRFVFKFIVSDKIRLASSVISAISSLKTETL